MLTTTRATSHHVYVLDTVNNWVHLEDRLVGVLYIQTPSYLLSFGPCWIVRYEFCGLCVCKIGEGICGGCLCYVIEVSETRLEF